MFIKFLIVIFAVFIIYLFFSNETILEGMKKRRKLRFGKKGGLKKRAKKAKKAVVDAVEDAVEDVEDAVDEADVLPTIDELPQLVNDLRLRVETIGTQVEGLLAEKPTISASAMDEEPDDGDLGI
jgi:hypothetical protein